MSKFITRLLRHSKQVSQEEDGGVHYDTGYWSDEMKKQFAVSPHWSFEYMMSVLAKGGGQKKKVAISREPELFSEILVPSSNPRTFRKYNQSCIARHCMVTRRFHRVYLSRRKRKRTGVNSQSWCDSRRGESQKRQTCCSSLS